MPKRSINNKIRFKYEFYVPSNPGKNLLGEFFSKIML